MTLSTDDGSTAAALAMIPKESGLRDVAVIPSLMRAGSMLQSVYGSIDDTLDEAGRARVARIYGDVVTMMDEAFTGSISDEMHRMFTALDASPSSSVLRVVYAQLSSWLGVVVSSEVSRMTAGAMGLFASLDATDGELVELPTEAPKVLAAPGYL